MPAEIDIIVSSPDSTEARLIVEAKLSVQDFASAEAQLKNYMLQLSCPVALIVTPEKMTVYADQYLSTRPDSIKKVGEFQISDLLRFQAADFPHALGRHFESAVQRWLEALPRTATRDRVKDKDLWQVLNKYVLPAIETGEVRAAAPRY